MGLSSKQVSSSGLDWNNNLLESQKLEVLPKPHHQMKKQQQQQQSEQQSSETLKCPRCDSSNTKFCYYNNYNKSQPRHFCRACKRHWTKGGTLRNVPVGGGRKNKRNKKPITPTTTTTATTTTSTITNKTSTCTTSFTNTTMNNNLQTANTPLAVLSDHKNIASSSLYQALIRPPPSLLLQQQNNNNNNLMNMRDLVESGKDFGSSMTLSSSQSQNQNLLFPFSISSSCFYTNPCSVSTTSLRSSSNVYNYVEESTINSVIPPSTTNSAAATNTQLWEMLPAATSGGTTAMGMSNYWSWEDIDSLVSTDLKDPWDDSDIKP